jgi:hypothetical protein
MHSTRHHLSLGDLVMVVAALLRDRLVVTAVSVVLAVSATTAGGCGRRTCSDIATDYFHASGAALACDPGTAANTCTAWRPGVLVEVPNGAIVDPRDDNLYWATALSTCSAVYNQDRIETLDRYLAEYNASGCVLAEPIECFDTSGPGTCQNPGYGFVCITPSSFP